MPIEDFIPVVGSACDPETGCPKGFKCVGGNPDENVPGRCRPKRETVAAGAGLSLAALLVLG